MTLFIQVTLYYCDELRQKLLSSAYQANNLDRYIIRSCILRELNKIIPSLSGTLLDVGCGQMPYKPLVMNKNTRVEKYIGLDLEGSLHAHKCLPDLLWNGHTIPLDQNTVDCAMATEVLEHCPEPESTMKEILRVLKPGGLLFFTVPFLWNLHEAPYDEYRYTPFSLNRHLENSGFTNISIEALGGWDAALGQMLGLWIRRRLKGETKKDKAVRELLSWLFLPVIGFLYDHDHAPKTFEEGTMITGLSGVAVKKR